MGKIKNALNVQLTTSGYAVIQVQLKEQIYKPLKQANIVKEEQQ